MATGLRVTSLAGNDIPQTDQKFSDAQVQRIRERRKMMASEDTYSLPNSPRDSPRATVAGKLRTAEKSLSRLQSSRLAPATSDDATGDVSSARKTILQKQRDLKIARKETIRESLSQGTSPIQSPRSVTARGRSASKLSNLSPNSPSPRSKLFSSPTENRSPSGAESTSDSPKRSALKRRETIQRREGTSSPSRKNSFNKTMSGVRIFSEEETLKPALKVRSSLDRGETWKQGTSIDDTNYIATPSGRRRSERRNSVDIGETILHGARLKSSSSLYRHTEMRVSINEADEPLSPKLGKRSPSPKDSPVDLGMMRNLETFLLDDFDHRIFAVNISRESKSYLASVCKSLKEMRKVSTEEMQSVFKAHYSVFLRVINDVQGLHGKVSEIGRQLEQLQQIVRFRTKASDTLSAVNGTLNTTSNSKDNDDEDLSRDRSSSVSISSWLGDLDKKESRKASSLSIEIKDKEEEGALTKSYQDFEDSSMTKLEDLLEQFEQTVSEGKLLESAVLAKEIQRYIAATSSTSQNQNQRQDVINEFLYAYTMFKTSLMTATHDSASDPDTLKHLILSIVELEGEHAAQKVLLESFSLWNSQILHATSRSRSSSWDERIQTVTLLTNSIVSIIARGLEQADKLLGNQNNALSSYAFLWAQNELAKGLGALKRLGPNSGIVNLADFVSIIVKNIKWLEEKSHISLMGVSSKSLISILRPAIIQTIRSSGMTYSKEVSGSPRQSSPLSSLSRSQVMSPNAAVSTITVNDNIIGLENVRSSYTKQIIERMLHLICLLDQTVNEVSLLWQVPFIFCEILEQRARGHIGVVELDYGSHPAQKLPVLKDNGSEMTTSSNAEASSSNSSSLLDVQLNSESIESENVLDLQQKSAQKEESQSVMLRTCNSDNLGLDVLSDAFELPKIILKFCKDRLQLGDDEGGSVEEELACSSAVYRNVEFKHLGKKLRQGFARLWAGTLCEKNTNSINVNVYLVDIVDQPADTVSLHTLEEQSLWTNEVIHVAMNIRSLVESQTSNREQLSMIHIRFAIECMRFISYHEFWNDMTQISKQKGALTFHDLGFMYLIHDVYIMKIIFTRLYEQASGSNSMPSSSSTSPLSASSKTSDMNGNINALGHTSSRKSQNSKSLYEDYEILSVLEYTCKNIIDKANSIYVKINETAPDAEIVERGREAAISYVKTNYNLFFEDADQSVKNFI